MRRIISSDLIDSSDNNSKGCRGSARDKDKDKDQDQEVLKFKDLNTEGEKGVMFTGRRMRRSCFWGKSGGSRTNCLKKRDLVNEFINKYGFASVEFAFREGVKYNKMSLAYVDAICKKQKEKADQAEYKERDKRKLHESIMWAEEERKSGKCLKLVRDNLLV